MFDQFGLPCSLNASPTLLSSQQCVSAFVSCCDHSAHLEASASSTAAEAGVDDNAMSSVNAAPSWPTTTRTSTTVTGANIAFIIVSITVLKVHLFGLIFRLVITC